MDLKKILKPTQNKMLLFVYLFGFIILLGAFSVTYVNDKTCEGGGYCSDIKSEAFGIPPFYFAYVQFGGGDAGEIIFSFSSLIVNLIVLYLLSCLFALKTNFLEFSKRKIKIAVIGALIAFVGVQLFLFIQNGYVEALMVVVSLIAAILALFGVYLIASVVEIMYNKIQNKKY